MHTVEVNTPLWQSEDIRGCVDMAAAEAVYDHARHRKLADAIEKMVCSGEPVLDAATLAMVKTECRGNDAILRTAFETTMIVMAREHAQIRLGCLRLFEYLFLRSALFRELAVLDFQTFVELCVGVDDTNKPLPPPKRFATELRTAGLRFVQDAHRKHGSDYKQIDLAYRYLRRTLKVDFEATQAASRAEQEAADRRAALATRRQAESCRKVRVMH